jgi:hypothetical protein
MVFVGGIAAIEFAHGGAGTQNFVDIVKVDVPTPKAEDRPGGLLTFEEFSGFRTYTHFRVDRLLAAMFVPVLAFWALAWLCVFVFRWVVAGFKIRNK